MISQRPFETYHFMIRLLLLFRLTLNLFYCSFSKYLSSFSFNCTQRLSNHKSLSSTFLQKIPQKMRADAQFMVKCDFSSLATRGPTRGVPNHAITQIFFRFHAFTQIFFRFHAITQIFCRFHADMLSSQKFNTCNIPRVVRTYENQIPGTF